MPLKIAILASGTGTNAQAIIDKCKAGILDVDIELLICNNPDAEAPRRAARCGVPCKIVNHRDYPDRLAYDRELAEILMGSGCQLIALAGWMRLFTGAFLKSFKNRVINIHPALLPSFPGTTGIQDALEYGVKITGVTVHFVEEKTDSGPVIIQAALPVKDSDSMEELAAKIHALEHRIYPQALQWLSQGRISLVGRQVMLAAADARQAAQPADALIWPPLEEGF